MTRHTLLPAILLVSILTSCRTEELLPLPEPNQVDDPASPQPDDDGYTLHGFYLLNEGNMGTNKSTLDYMDFATGVYTRNIYAAANPDKPMELGDVGNDLATYGTKLWAVINCSNKVEVMRAKDAVSIGQIDIPNCRSIAFHDGYAYVTSYAGPVEITPEYKQSGYVAKIDTATLREVARCIVGFQPDGISIADDKIYVANSGGYMVPNYENTLSIIDINTFKEEKRVEIAINLDNVLTDKHGNIWISNRGDYYNVSPRLYCYNPREGVITASIDVPVSAMTLHDDDIYIVGSAFNYVTYSNEPAAAIVNTTTRTLTDKSFIDPRILSSIKRPYGIEVNPVSGDIYVTDGGNYVTPGWLYCLTPDGSLKWKQRTGDLPAHIAFHVSIIK